MGLAAQLRPYFEPECIRRGQAYFNQGRVLQSGMVEDTIYQCLVQGNAGAPYKVCIEWDVAASEVEATCTCPHYDDGNWCKHLWAAILDLDTEIVAPSFPQRVHFVPFEEPPDEEGEVTKSTPWRGSGVSYQNRAWSSHLDEIDVFLSQTQRRRLGQTKLVWYEIQLSSYSYLSATPFCVRFWQRPRTKKGWGKLKVFSFRQAELELLEDDQDKEILTSLTSVNPTADYFTYNYGTYEGASLSASVLSSLLPKLSATGRLGYFNPESGSKGIEDFIPISFQAGPPYHFELEILKTKKHWELQGSLVCSGSSPNLKASDVLGVFSEGLFLGPGFLARMEHKEWESAWLKLLSQEALLIPLSQETAFSRKLASMPFLPSNRIPQALGYEIKSASPHPIVSFEEETQDRIRANLQFRYGKDEVEVGESAGSVIDPKARIWTFRDRSFERAFLEQLVALGFKISEGPELSIRLARSLLFEVVTKLVELGCELRLEGKSLRTMGRFSSKVRSGIDWFELEGEAQFGESSASLARLLGAVKKGQSFVTLDDGSRGLIPEEWKKPWLPLLKLGKEAQGELRFKNSQALLIEALLTEQIGTNWDERFSCLVRRLKQAARPENPAIPEHFFGELRQYQKEGLGWLLYLKDLGLGGCLADDMGLGKTVQVLALLERERSQKSPPSLVVVPRSLVFNWIKEASRFTPKLRVTEFDRTRHFDPAAADLWIITYSMLRDNILVLKDHSFHYVILDEAQAIKNPSSQSAKATLLLQANHRLVVTGTPVENHPRDIWSLFEFLNPGMLGLSTEFQNLLRGGKSLSLVDMANSEVTLRKIGQGLRPFILRRTKEAVLKELPPKTEQIIYCELEPSERKVYDELRDHYKRTLEEKIDREGWNKSQFVILEALLRLRQAACHPKLARPEYLELTSTKTRALLEQVREVVESGHKALVFSQFTSFLSLVRDQIDNEKIDYEYLDGKTRNREERVKRFQESSSCKLFLLSLKAGGVGLNLTAADYVFLLDPWWNPAAEAQAIDRTHRIGQGNPVFAYRLVARNTVEERVIELQSYKRKIKDTLIASDEKVLQTLTARDLAFLFE